MQETAINAKPASFRQMFFGPAATLESLREHPHWFSATLFAAAVSVAANLYLIHRIGLKSLMRALAQAEKALDPDALVQTALAHQSRILFFQSAGTFLSCFLMALLTATILWLILTVIGYEIPFRKILAVSAYANMLSVVLRAVLTALAVAIIQDFSAFDPRNPLATNPAFFLRPASPVVSGILASLDLITFINIGLLIAGLMKVVAKISPRVASMTVIVPWATYVGVTLLVSVLAS